MNAVADAQRDDSSVPVADLISAYENGSEELRAAVAGLTTEQLRTRPVPGKWSTLEVVCHITDCEQFFADRLKRTAAMDRPLLIGADGFRYPEPLHYQEHDLDEEVNLVAITRQQMARTLRLVAPDVWQRTAVHSETGLLTMRQLLLHAINHLRHHLRFIAEAGGDEMKTSMRGGSHAARPDWTTYVVEPEANVKRSDIPLRPPKQMHDFGRISAWVFSLRSYTPD